MSTQTWPASIPQQILRDGFSTEDDSQFVESSMDVGPPKIRRRSTKAYGNVSGTIRLASNTDVATMRSFYNTDLAGGTGYFYFDDPTAGTTREFRFTAPPTFTPFGAGFAMNFTWKVKPE